MLLVLIGGIYAYNKVQETSYTIGFNDATLTINKQIISNLVQNGFITIYVPINETTAQRVILVPSQQN